MSQNYPSQGSWSIHTAVPFNCWSCDTPRVVPQSSGLVCVGRVSWNSLKAVSWQICPCGEHMNWEYASRALTASASVVRVEPGAVRRQKSHSNLKKFNIEVGKLCPMGHIQACFYPASSVEIQVTENIVSVLGMQCDDVWNDYHSKVSSVNVVATPVHCVLPVAALCYSCGGE